MFKDIFINKLLAQISAVIIAFGLWLHISTRDITEVAISVPLELYNFPEKMVVADNLPEGISLRLRGPAAQTRYIDDRKLRFRLDLSNAKKGINEFTLAPDSLGLPRGLTVSRLNPSMVSVNLEPITTKTVKVSPMISGEPANGFYLEGVVIDPSVLTIKGPLNILEDIELIWSSTIDISNARQTINLKASPVVPDPGVTVTTTELFVRAIIMEHEEEKTFKSLPLIHSANIITDTKKVELKLIGPQSVIKNLQPENINIVVKWPENIKSFDEQVISKVEVDVPTRVRVLSVKPENVRVRLASEPTILKEDELIRP